MEGCDHGLVLYLVLTVLGIEMFVILCFITGIMMSKALRK